MPAQTLQPRNGNISRQYLFLKTNTLSAHSLAPKYLPQTLVVASYHLLRAHQLRKPTPQARSGGNSEIIERETVATMYKTTNLGICGRWANLKSSLVRQSRPPATASYNSYYIVVDSPLALSRIRPYVVAPGVLTQNHSSICPLRRWFESQSYCSYLFFSADFWDGTAIGLGRGR